MKWWGILFSVRFWGLSMLNWAEDQMVQKIAYKAKVWILTVCILLLFYFKKIREIKVDVIRISMPQFDDFFKIQNVQIFIIVLHPKLVGSPCNKTDAKLSKEEWQIKYSKSDSNSFTAKFDARWRNVMCKEKPSNFHWKTHVFCQKFFGLQVRCRNQTDAAFT